MVKKFEKTHKSRTKKKFITADIIILGCSLPGIVAAHKLMKKFGNTIDIMILDLASQSSKISKCNVAFQTISLENPVFEEEEDNYVTGIDHLARHYLVKYFNDFKIPLPDAVYCSVQEKSSLSKLFQYRNGTVSSCSNNFNEFDYLTFLERFELSQYQTYLDHSMRDLFQTQKIDTQLERSILHYYDQTSMEQHICNALLFSNSREYMQLTVRLVCGVSASKVSVLFYLHQCHRTNSAKNHIDGDNTRLREKLIGYCRKRIASKLQQSIAGLITTTKPIKEIRSYSDAQLILETMKGETNYVCTLLAMALKPNELSDISFDAQICNTNQADIAKSMIPGKSKKFIVQYEDNFWRKEGYSGDIVSIQGPILWAMERPMMSTTGSTEKYAALIGYLKVRDDQSDSRDIVLEQIKKLFGEEAVSPVSYRESDISDIFVPRCGDFVALRKLTGEVGPKQLQWGALDIFSEGDIAAALEAGHKTYLQMLSCLRPQAQTFEDIRTTERTDVGVNIFSKWSSQVNYIQSMRLASYAALVMLTFHLVKKYMAKL